MHGILGIQEIAEVILSYCSDSTLRRLAQTCTYMSSLATNELYLVIENPKQLVASLPRDYHSIALQQEQIQELTDRLSRTECIAFVGGPTLEAWYPKNATKTWTDLWNEIHEVNERSIAWSRLKRIVLDEQDEMLLAPLHGTKAPRLQTIRIRLLQPQQAYMTLRSMLSGLECPQQLRVLDICCNDYALVPSSLLASGELHHLCLRAPYTEIPEDQLLTQNPYRLYSTHSVRFQARMLEKYEGIKIAILDFKYLLDQFPTKLGSGLTAFQAVFCALLVLRSGTGCRNAIKKALGIEYDEARGRRARFNPQTDVIDIDHLPMHDIFKHMHRKHLDRLYKVAYAMTGLPHRRSGLLTTHTLERGHSIRNAFILFKPMPRLRKLCLSTAPDFLRTLDVPLYVRLAKHIPLLECLIIEQVETEQQQQEVDPALLPTSWPSHLAGLHHLTAFCCLLPKLEEISLSFAVVREPQYYRLLYPCMGVKRANLSAYYVYGRIKAAVTDSHLEQLQQDVKAFFPCSDTARGCHPISVYSGDKCKLRTASLIPKQPACDTRV